jgi:hypothetical protein
VVLPEGLRPEGLRPAVVRPEGLPPEGLLREVLHRRAEWRVLLTELRSAQPALPRPESARPDVPGDPHLECPARPSAAAARKVRARRATGEAEAMVAQRLAQAERLAPRALQAAVAAAVREAQQVLGGAAAQPPAAPEVRDAVVARQPAAASAWAEARRPAAAAVQDAAEVVQRRAAVQDAAEVVQRRAAEPASAAVRPRGAEGAAPDAEEAPLRGEAEPLDVAAVPHRVARDEGARLLAAAWAGLPSTRLQAGRLAPSARAQSAHAREGLRTARP